MTKRAVFYLIPEETEQARWVCACRLTDKAYRQGLPVYIHIPTKEAAQQFDDLLWIFKDTSFVPHALYDGKTDLPVQIGYAIPTNLPDTTVFINLAQDIPDVYKQFHHIIEIVPQETTLRKKAREHYRYYREQGYEPESHTL